MLKNFYSKVPIAYSMFYSITLGLAVFYILQNIQKKKIRLMVLGGLALIIVLQSLPFIRGEVNNMPIFCEERGVGRNIKFPRYYQQAMDYIKSLNEGRVLTLPLTTASWSIFRQDDESGAYIGSSPVKIFTGKDDFNGKLSFEIIPGLQELIIKASQGSFDSFGSILKSLNIDYVIYDANSYNIPEIIRTSWLWEYDIFSNQAYIEKLIPEITEKKLISFGTLSVYKVKDRFLSPRIHPASNPDDGVLRLKPVTLESKQARNIPLKEKPGITFVKINPTKYLVKIENAKAPFWLVFNEIFHEEWELYLPDKVNGGYPVFNESVTDYAKFNVNEVKHALRVLPGDIKFIFKTPLKVPHRLANGYANGWYIEPKDLGLGKNFILEIYFRPQSLFYFGLAASGLMAAVWLGYLLLQILKRIAKAIKEI
jgi:hypothetical protein